MTAQADSFSLLMRHRQETAPGSGSWQKKERQVQWEANRTAVVICDMWDQHWCQGATRRVGEMASRMNELVRVARARGALILHCPSGTMAFYEGTPQRRLAQAAPQVATKVPLQGWCHLDSSKEAPLPIDDSDGGCDDEPACRSRQAWSRQIDVIEIEEGDAITDSAEAYYLMRQRGITNVMVMGVHLNMCVLGRPFSIRQMVSQGQNVVLVRDLTDTMYNSRKHPFVPHCAGTDLMVEHVEKYWCPTVASTDLLGGRPFRFSEDKRPKVVFMIGEDEYRTWETLPAFAEAELGWRGFEVTILAEDAERKGRFEGLARVLPETDLLLVSVRRRAPMGETVEALRAYLAAGRSLVGIRTASHAFDVRGQAKEGEAEWPEFDAQVLGGNYHGHYGEGPKTRLRAAPGAESEGILRGIELGAFQGHGSLYKTAPLASGTGLLLLGTIPGQPEEPVAWTHRYGPRQARVFYTSLGHPEDFQEASFRRLLVNAICWALGRPIPE